MTTMIPAPNNSEAPNNRPTLLGWEKEGQRRRREEVVVVVEEEDNHNR
jgi:hypothetical protein